MKILYDLGLIGRSGETKLNDFPTRNYIQKFQFLSMQALKLKNQELARNKNWYKMLKLEL